MLPHGFHAWFFEVMKRLEKRNTLGLKKRNVFQKHPDNIQTKKSPKVKFESILGPMILGDADIYYSARGVFLGDVEANHPGLQSSPHHRDYETLKRATGSQ